MEDKKTSGRDYETTIEHLYSVMARLGGPDPILLLGAGASVKSGIPLSGELVERAAKWAFCRTSGRSEDDPTIRRSDWFPWLEDFSWYHRDLALSDNYSTVIEHILQPREDRKEFLLRIIKPNVPASKGYERLVDFMAQHIVRTILTTNFDAVLPDLCRERQRPHHVEIIKTPYDLTKFSTSPTYPQLIYLHGSIEHYSDKNLMDEVQRLDENLIKQIFPLIRDHPLIVIGYRGAEPSVMRHLLLELASNANYYRQGIFWCTTQDSLANGLPPLVSDLATTIGGNFQVIPINGFDELLDELWNMHQRQPSLISPSLPAQQGSVFPAPTFDMEPLTSSSLEELDWSRVQTSITDYCRRMGTPIPSPVTRTWLIDRLFELDLARKQDAQPVLTIAGYLLFARNPLNRVPSAQVVLQVSEETEYILTGHLWSQLDQMMESFEELNRPFRLKGPVSETVFPYPPLALKELVVNALVHRNYEDSQRVVIEVEPHCIHITNPGGLVDEVVQRVAQPLQAEIEQGKRGIKGYRNPVIADLFYGAGAMDKAGSGLADVQKWVNENEGKVVFGPKAENTVFEVALFRRSEVIDEVTGVATPLLVTGRYLSNLLEVSDWPDTVWHAGTTARKTADVWEGIGDIPLPAFILADTRLYTFTELRDPANPFCGKIDPTDVRAIATTDFITDKEGERRFVRLLNQSLFRYFSTQRLIVDRKRQRAYFPRSNAGPREITYQARIRRATRTVTKPVISKVTQRVRYWEHEAIRFGFERFNDAWVLHLVPSYVFTVDGSFKLVEGSRVGALATRRAARDYNPQVHNDLIFWLWVLARGIDHFLLETGVSQSVEVRAQYASGIIRGIAPEHGIADIDISTGSELLKVEEELDELIAMMNLDSKEITDDTDD
jgi:hypothetical protein